MSFMTRVRKQKAVWWARSTKDRFGKYSFAEPVEVSCRWDDTAQEFLDYQGELQASRALVYPDRVMVPGDRLMLGELESDTPVDPMSIRTAYEIRRFDQNPNFRATETWYTAYL